MAQSGAVQGQLGAQLVGADAGQVWKKRKLIFLKVPYLSIYDRCVLSVLFTCSF